MSSAAFPRPSFALGSTAAADEQVRLESLAVAQGLKRQDAGLLDELIVRYQHRLLRYLLYLTSNREMAEDLFQEVWMRVLVRGAQFNGQARFEVGREEDKPMSFEVAGDEPTPFDRFSNLEDRQRIAASLLQLDTLHREVLVLRFHEELSLEEIAKVTRAPLSTVKSRLYRGLAAIKPKLERSQMRRLEMAECPRARCGARPPAGAQKQRA